MLDPAYRRDHPHADQPDRAHASSAWSHWTCFRIDPRSRTCLQIAPDPGDSDGMINMQYTSIIINIRHRPAGALGRSEAVCDIHATLLRTLVVGCRTRHARRRFHGSAEERITISAAAVCHRPPGPVSAEDRHSSSIKLLAACMNSVKGPAGHREPAADRGTAGLAPSVAGGGNCSN